MQKNSVYITLILFAIFAAMLSMPDIIKSGALDGLNLWLFTLVPTLLPFMIISSVIMETGSYSVISCALRRIMHLLFRLPADAGYPFLMGLLCGFPMGSKITADMVNAGSLSVHDGNILITFCNNISPPFIISYLAAYVLRLPPDDMLFVCTVMFAAPVLTGIVTSRTVSLLFGKSSASPARAANDIHTLSAAGCEHPRRNIIDSAILGSFESIVRLGGYIILFTILCHVLASVITSPLCCCMLSGLLEITSGLSYFAAMPISSGIVTASCTLTSFGGLCALAQTCSMIHGSRLHIGIYIYGKVINSFITFITLYIYYCINPLY